MNERGTKRPAGGDEERQSKRARTEGQAGRTDAELRQAYEGIFQHFLGDKKVSPESVKAEWDKTLAEAGKARQQTTELKLHESVLVIRLSSKEQEIHQLHAELADLRKNAAPPRVSARNTMLDPTVNALFQRMKEELDLTKQKLRQSQEDLNAATFTRESSAGRQLLNRIRLLQKENEELGQQLSEGNTHKLELEISLMRELTEDLKKVLHESNEYVLRLEEERGK